MDGCTPMSRLCYSLAMSNNERITESLVRKQLEKVGITEEAGFLIEEQKSENPRIAKLLRSASKNGNGAGKPEFIISHKDDAQFLLVIECKADTKFHVSKSRDQYAQYAVDGVLLYAAHLARDFHVIAVAASGQKQEELKIDVFLHPRGAAASSALMDNAGKPIHEILSWNHLLRYATFDCSLAQARFSDLMKFSRELHNYMRDYCKITEAEKPLLVSGVLLAFMDNAFKATYLNYKQETELPQELFVAIKRVLEGAELGTNQPRKKDAVVNVYRFIPDHPELSRFQQKANETPLFHVVHALATEVQPFIEDHFDFDVIGNFYGEFIRYTGGDKKGLGIVLTPRHITELFADIAKLTKNSVVLDTCTGTAGFLISAMRNMLDQASTEAEKDRICKESLIGIEQEPKMFALAASNMILRGDGKTNLFRGSCFDKEILDMVHNRADAGFINPPYSQKGEDLHEWNFVFTLLDALKKSGTGIVIAPMSLAIAPHRLREQLLSRHRLEAVMSMPDDLFYPVGVVPCIMVFTAHIPHASDAYHESWFGYWKDDGFRKDRVEGRIPTDRWPAIREKWLTTFSRREIVPGFSVRRKVGVDDEWCAEAYLETDYDGLSIDDFKDTLKKYFVYKALHEDRL